MGDQVEKFRNERDAGTFQCLFLTFWPKVRAMLMRQGADIETAEEIAQETMLAVWRKFNQFSNDRGSLSSWIFAIARNLRIDRMRQEPFAPAVTEAPPGRRARTISTAHVRRIPPWVGPHPVAALF